MPESFFVILGLALWIVLACWPAVIAKRKGYNFLLFLLFAVFVSFLLALLIVVLLKDKNQTDQDRADDAAAEAALRKEEGR